MVGIPLERLDTPVLVADLDILDANLARMAAFFTGKPAGFRPHFKNHRVVALALRQIEAGALGITCSRLWQVEGLARAGIRSILLTNEIAGEGPLRRLAELSRETTVMAAVDNAKVVDDMARIARDSRAPLNVVVDVDLGLKRCGVSPGEAAAALAQRAVAAGLRFRGIMGYEGHLQLLAPGLEKERIVKQALAALVGSKQQIEHLGIPVEIVSCGGTGDYAIGNLPRRDGESGWLLHADGYRIRPLCTRLPARAERAGDGSEQDGRGAPGSGCRGQGDQRRTRPALSQGRVRVAPPGPARRTRPHRSRGSVRASRGGR